MGLTPPYLSAAEIEAAANLLLAEYRRGKGGEVGLPVPVEAILESHLGLHFGFHDLRTKLGVPDVLGALYIESAEVIVDQALDPDERPFILPRFHFTLGHEIGHWRLHRPLILARKRQEDLFQQARDPSIICRTSQQRERIELQADAFAAALLMPRPAIVAHWQRLIGPERLKLSELCRRGKDFLAAAILARGNFSPDAQGQLNDVIEALIRPLADAFAVSRPAMRIRLEQLGFIVRDAETTMSLFEAV